MRAEKSREALRQRGLQHAELSSRRTVYIAESDEEMNPDVEIAQTAGDEKGDVDMDDGREEGDNLEGGQTHEVQGGSLTVAPGTKVPAWIEQYEFGAEAMSETPAVCVDPFARAAEIMDLVLGKWVTHTYNRIFKVFVQQSKELVTKCFESGHYTRRIDLNENVPYLGIDDAGFLIDPTAEDHKKHHDKKYKGQVKKETGTARADFADYMESFEASFVCKKLVLHCIRCGLPHQDLKDVFSTYPKGRISGISPGEMQARNKRAHESLAAQSAFVRRIIKGALDTERYSYFRPNIGEQIARSTYISPLGVLLAVPKNQRLVAALHACQTCGVVLNGPLKEQLSKAIAEAKKNLDDIPPWGALLDNGLHKAIRDSPA